MTDNTNGKIENVANNPNQSDEVDVLYKHEYKFPSNLASTNGDSSPDSINHMLVIAIIDETRQRNESNSDFKTVSRIYLPTPTGIANQFGAQWQDINGGIEIDAAKSIGAAVRPKLATLVPDIKNAFSNMKGTDYIDMVANVGEAAENYLKSPTNFFGGKAIFAGKVLDIGVGMVAKRLLNSDSVFGALGSGGNVAARNYVAQQFQNMNLRSFTFNWKLIAKSAKETETIREIEQLLKSSAHPKLIVDDKLVSYPFKFELQFMDMVGISNSLEQNKYLPKFKINLFSFKF